MIDLKLSKTDKKKAKEVPLLGEDYPYGTRLRFENETIQKIPALQDVKAGTVFTIKAIGKVTEVREVRITDNADKKKNYENVEIQVQKIEIGNADEAEEAFKE